MREASYLGDAMSLAERRATLASIVRTPLSQITPESPLCVEFSESVDQSGNVTRKAKKNSVIDAIKLDSQLAGELNGELNKQLTNPFLFLVSFGKPFERVAFNAKGDEVIQNEAIQGETGSSKKEIGQYVESTFGYDLSRTLDEIRPGYGFDVTCQGSVPEAIIAFLESTSYEDAIRGAISLGGDSDTQACITGGIAQAFYGGVPKHIVDAALAILDDYLRSITIEFMQRYCDKANSFRV